MIRQIVSRFLHGHDPIMAERWYYRYHCKEVVRAFGPWLRRYETQAVGGDDVQVEACQIEAAVAAQVGDAGADARQSILGEMDQSGSGGLDREPPESRGAGGDRDGEIKTEPGFAHLGAAADHSDGGGGPEVAHQPLGSVGLGIDGMDRHGGQRSGHGHSDRRAAITWPPLTEVWEDLAACCSAARARRSMARRLPQLISKIDS